MVLANDANRLLPVPARVRLWADDPPVTYSQHQALNRIADTVKRVQGREPREGLQLADMRRVAKELIDHWELYPEELAEAMERSLKAERPPEPQNL